MTATWWRESHCCWWCWRWCDCCIVCCHLLSLRVIVLAQSRCHTVTRWKYWCRAKWSACFNIFCLCIQLLSSWRKQLSWSRISHSLATEGRCWIRSQAGNDKHVVVQRQMAIQMVIRWQCWLQLLLLLLKQSHTRIFTPVSLVMHHYICCQQLAFEWTYAVCASLLMSWWSTPTKYKGVLVFNRIEFASVFTAALLFASAICVLINCA